MKPLDIAIIGGGASGVLTAARLLRVVPGARIALVEPSPALGRGVAYGTDDPVHLLNVRAGNMSADLDDPGHFVRWLEARGCPDADLPMRFACRRDYGVYLGDVLEGARRAAGAELRVLATRAVGISGGPRLHVALASSGVLVADHVVLALGNLPPSLPSALVPVAGSPRLVANPWLPGALDAIAPESRVLLVGTGLTAMDVLLSLNARGHRGVIEARSRHGLLPQVHAPATVRTADLQPGPRLLRRAARMIRASGADWRAAVDSLRPITVPLWQSLSWEERSRFHRRLRAFWDVHRHRMAPEVAAVVDGLRASGRLRFGAGAIRRVEAGADGFRIDVDRASLEADWIVNCTGPSADLAAAKLPLLESAAVAGLAAYDPLGQGLMVDDAGRSDRCANLWALGPLCRGCRFETTAIPEIRVQAARLANELAASP